MIRLLAILCLFVTVASGQPLTLNDPVFFTPKRIYAPIASQVLTISTNSTTTPTVTSSYTPTANALVLVSIGVQQTVTVNSLSGNGMTWEKVSSQFNATSNYRTEIWRGMTNAPITGALTVTFSGNPSVRGAMIIVEEFQNVYVDGSNGRTTIVQAVGDALQPGTVTGAVPNPNSQNAVVGVVGSSSGTTWVLQSGWTQDFGGGISPSSTQVMFLAHRLATTDATFTNSVGSGGSTFSFFMELRSANSEQYSLPPNTISNLVIWAKSDSGVYQDSGKSTPCTDGTKVALWANGGNTALTPDLTAAAISNQPTFYTGGGSNGQPRIYFNTNVMGATLTGSTNQPYSLVSIFRSDTNGSAYARLVWTTNNVQLDIDPTRVLDVWAGVTFQLGTIPVDNQTHIGVAIYNNATANYLFTDTVTNIPPTSNIGTAAMKGIFYIGGEVPAVTTPLIGDYYEVMYFSKALTLPEVSQIQIYARNKYGLIGY